MYNVISPTCCYRHIRNYNASGHFISFLMLYIYVLTLYKCTGYVCVGVHVSVCVFVHAFVSACVCECVHVYL